MDKYYRNYIEMFKILRLFTSDFQNAGYDTCCHTKFSHTFPQSVQKFSTSFPILAPTLVENCPDALKNKKGHVLYVAFSMVLPYFNKTVVIPGIPVPVHQ